jgi:hypothetical protein
MTPTSRLANLAGALAGKLTESMALNHEAPLASANPAHDTSDPDRVGEAGAFPVLIMREALSSVMLHTAIHSTMFGKEPLIASQQSCGSAQEH